MFRRVLPLVCVAAFLLGTTRPAMARELEEEEEKPDRHASITFSPILLAAASTVELLGEFRIAHKFSLAAIGAYGRPNGVNFYEVGGQARIYLIGGFDHGLNIGAQAMLAGANTSSGGLTGNAGGLAVGGFVGYKIAFRFGLTLDIHGGYQMMGIGGSATDDSSGETLATHSTVQGVPILRLNAGWSF